MPNSYYADNQLYLNFLEIEESDLTIKNDKVDKQELFKLVEKQFRKLARNYHPDFGGDEKSFKFLLKSKSKILEDSGKDSAFTLRLDDDKFDKFDPKSLAAELGNQLFELISAWAPELGIKPMMKPTSDEDVYEWIFNIIDTDKQLSLNVQNLRKELAELSHELYKDDSLSVLVCLFIPSKQLVEQKYEYDSSIKLTFNDIVLIESSNASDITRYFSDPKSLKEDLTKVKEGTMESRKGTVLKVKKTKEAIAKDQKVLEYLQNFKIFQTQYNEQAADFIESIPD